MSTTPLRVCVKAYAASHQFQRGVWGGGCGEPRRVGVFGAAVGCACDFSAAATRCEQALTGVLLNSLHTCNCFKPNQSL
jgi:hypothetical protein